MTLEITPGPIPKDGTKLPDPETVLTQFVERTKVANFGHDEFTGVAAGNTTDDGTELHGASPYVVSQTEPPRLKKRGMLWFHRGEGRLYLWQTAMPSGASTFRLAEGFESEFSLLSGASAQSGAFQMHYGHWQCLSDRRTIPCLYYSEYGQDSSTEPLVGPYQLVKLNYGGVHRNILESGATQTPDTVTYRAQFNPQLPYDGDYTPWAQATDQTRTSNPNLFAWYGPRVSSNNIDFNLQSAVGQVHTSKFFAHTTNVTLPWNRLFLGMFLDIGFYRVGTACDFTGPAFGVYPSTDPAMENWNSREVRVYDKDVRLVGFATESGPSTDRRHLTFFLGRCPNANYQVR